MRLSQQRPRRSGATAVEAALVLGIMLFIVFSIFEYCRYLFVLGTLNQAARQGARYAAVNVSKPANFNTVDYFDGTTTYTNIATWTTNVSGGMNNMLTGFSVSVFPCDMAQLAQTPPVVTPKAGFPATVAWNNATFTEMIAVRITGTYTTTVPNFLFWQSSFALTIDAVTTSEG